jgi:hypothetical protein
MIRGHCSAHTLWSYFNPASKTATDDPATARNIASRSVRSAATVSPPSGAARTLRLTSRNAVLFALSSGTISFAIDPPAPSSVIILAPFHPCISLRPPDLSVQTLNSSARSQNSASHCRGSCALRVPVVSKNQFKFAPLKSEPEFHAEWLRDGPCDATTTGLSNSGHRCQLSLTVGWGT